MTDTFQDLVSYNLLLIFYYQLWPRVARESEWLTVVLIAAIRAVVVSIAPEVIANTTPVIACEFALWTRTCNRQTSNERRVY